MAKSATAARAYARAFTSLHRDKVKPASEELDRVLRSCVNDPVIWYELNDQSVSASTRIAGLRRRLPWLSQEVLSFLLLIVKRERIVLLPEIAAELRRECLILLGREELTVTSAFPLSDDQVNEIKVALERRLGRSVDLCTVVNPAIMGGLVITGEAWELDLSLRADLARLRAQLEADGS